MNFDWEARLIYKVRSGSHLYGTNHEGSDEDFRGIIIPPASYFLGLDTFEQYEGEPDEDICYYDIRKFIRLALAGNPNVIEILWSEEPQDNKWGNGLRGLRGLFTTKALVKPHIGMAVGNMKRFKQTGKFKLAAHAIRVLEQGRDLLLHGYCDFPRANAVFLREVIRGEWTQDSLCRKIEDRIEALRQVEAESNMADQPDRKMIGGLIQELIINYLKAQGEL